MNPSIHALHSAAVQQRSVVIVIPDADLRQRLGERLSSLRWRVLTAAGGAEAMVHLDEAAPEAMIVDHWLPDLDAAEFSEQAAAMCPGTDLLQTDGSSMRAGCKSTRRHELLHALREAQEETSAPSAAVPSAAPATSSRPGQRRVAAMELHGWPLPSLFRLRLCHCCRFLSCRKAVMKANRQQRRRCVRICRKWWVTRR